MRRAIGLRERDSRSRRLERVVSRLNQIHSDLAPYLPHVLTRMVVYETLLFKRRRELHQRVAETLEAQHAGKLENCCDDLAHHYQNRDHGEKAVHYPERAGRRAAQFFSLVEARLHYRAAILPLDFLPQAPETWAKRIDLSLKFVQVSYYALSEEPLAMPETSLASARELGDEGRPWKVLSSMGAVHFMLGNMNVAQERSRETFAIGKMRADGRLLGLGHAIIGRLKWYTAEHTKGLQHLRQSTRIPKPLGMPEGVAFAFAFEGMHLGWTGLQAEGRDCLRAAEEQNRKAGDLTREAAILNLRGVFECLFGNWIACVGIVAKATEPARRTGEIWQVGQGTALKAFVTIALGESHQGMEAMREAVRTIEAMGTRSLVSLWYGWMAEHCAATGAFQDAIELATKGLAHVAASGERIRELAAMRALAVASAAETGADGDAVEERMGAILKLADRRGHRPETALTHYAYAEVLQRRGDTSRAHEHLHAATTRYAEMGMAWWLPRAGDLQARSVVA